MDKHIIKAVAVFFSLLAASAAFADNSCEDGGDAADVVTFVFDCAKKNNSETANHQRSDVDKGLAALTGMGAEDIRRNNSILGGNSEMRKACDAVTGIFGGHC